MSNPKAIAESRKGKLHAVERIYGIMTLHEPTEASDPGLADRLRVPKTDIRNAREDLVAIDALKIERISLGTRQGWTSRWTLTTPETVAKARLEAKWREDDKETERRMHVMAANNARNFTGRKRAPDGSLPALGGATPDHPVVPSTLVHSSGPQPSHPLAPTAAATTHDEPRALIEAARQYHEVNRQLDAKVKELEALGMTVDRAALAKAIKAPHDHTLLIVSKVLPYVEQLERANTRLTEQVADLREKVTELPTIRADKERLAAANRRLVDENVGLRQQLHNRGEVGPRIPPKAEVKPVTAGNGVAPAEG